MTAKRSILAKVRKSISALAPYSSARSEFSGRGEVFLDANENALGSAIDLPYVQGDLNRYPDPLHSELRKKIASLKKIKFEQIFVGNGSDEAIDLILRVFCEPAKDAILITPPTYGMYQVIADIQGLSVQKAFLDSEYALDFKALKKTINAKTKVIFICSPNNPTGNAFSLEQIEAVLKLAPAIVVVDEAYTDFSAKPSALALLPKYQNLVVIQTLSKAWGMAAARVGFAYASKEIISLLNKIKFPYNLSALAQSAALEALEQREFLKSSRELLIAERERLSDALILCPQVERIFPSDANFLLVKFKDAPKVFNSLIKKGIITRDRSQTKGCTDCIRITVGNEEENDQLLRALGVFDPSAESKPQAAKAELRRKTKETDIKVTLAGPALGIRIKTGIGFFDHMLHLFAAHSGLGLKLVCKGDLNVDSHHSIEDCAIVLGSALRKFLGEVKGICRYGFYLPMDEASAQTAIDISGRAHLEWQVVFGSDTVGDIQVSLFEHFFKSFCDSARITLHIKAEGKDDHHIIEAVFKSVARSLKMALQSDGSNIVPSTKGSL